MSYTLEKSNWIKAHFLVLFVASWPFLSFFQENWKEEGFNENFYIYWLVYLALTQLILLAARGIFRRSDAFYLACLVSTASAVFTTFNIFNALFRKVVPEGLVIEYVFYALFCCAALGMGVWLFRYAAAKVFFFYFALALIAVPTIQLVSPLVFFEQEEKLEPQAESAEQSGAEETEPDGGGKFESRPNVYMFIPDEYVRADVLEELTGFDNKEFLSQLKARGFKTVPRGHSNYGKTGTSIATTLSMQFIIAEGKNAEYRPIIKYGGAEKNKIKYGEGRVIKKFRDNGYKYYFATSRESFVGDSCPPGPDYCYQGRGGLGELEANLLKLTPMLNILRKYFVDFVSNYMLRPEWVVDNMPDTGGAPLFTVTHFVQPHSPYVSNADCSIRETGPKNQWDFLVNFRWSQNLPPEVQKEYYLDNLKCANIRLMTAVDRILEQDPDAVIIIQGDHGTGHKSKYQKFHMPVSEWTKEELMERHSAFNTLRLPEKCRELIYPTMTLVNTYRIVFACLEGRKPKLQPDKLYAGTYANSDMELFADFTNLQPTYE